MSLHLILVEYPDDPTVDKLVLGAAQRAVAAAGDVLPEALGGNINLRFISEEGMRLLNNERAGDNYATDVLSFSYLEEGGEPIDNDLGDVVVCLSVVLADANERKRDLTDEVALRAVHGTLHVLGYDHGDKMGLNEMESLQNQAMEVAGLNPRPFLTEKKA